MPFAYDLPAGADNLDDGVLSPDGALVWTGDDVYAWAPSAGWIDLASPGSNVEAGSLTDTGVLVWSEHTGIGFWAFGDREWTWWREMSSLPFTHATPPTREWLVADAPGAPDDSSLLVYRASPDGLKRWAEVEAPPTSHGYPFVRPAPSACSNHGKTPTEAAAARLYLLSDEALHWHPIGRCPAGEENGSGTENGSFQRIALSFGETAETLIDRFPPAIGGALSPPPPTLVGNRLFLHRGASPTTATSLQLHLDDGTVSATGLVPFARSRRPWIAYAEDDSETAERLLDTVVALPPDASGTALITVDLVDIAVENGEVQAVLAEEGLCPPDRFQQTIALARSVETAEGDGDPERGISSDAPLTWKLWLGHEDAERSLYRNVAAANMNKDAHAESLQVLVGRPACERLFEELRGDDPPRSHISDFNYNGDSIRALFGVYGPEVAPLAERGLSDDRVPVRVAACLAASANDADHSPVLSELDPTPVPTSLLWPGRETFPKAALWKNLSHEHSDVRRAAAKTCARIRLDGSAPHLRPLLHATPLLDDAHKALRHTALHALRVLPDVSGAAVEDAERCARSDPSSDIRRGAVNALRSLGRGSSTLEALIWALGDTTPCISNAVEEALMEQGEEMTPSQYCALTDRWLLRSLGHRRSDGDLSFATSFPEQMPRRVLTRMLIGGNVRDLQPPFDWAADVTLTGEALQMAPTALSLTAVRAAAFEERSLAEAKPESPPTQNCGTPEELERRVEARLWERTFLHEIDPADLSYGFPPMQAAEYATRVYDHDPPLARRLAALVLGRLGLPQASGDDTDSSGVGHRPLHRRLQSFSGDTPRETCHRYVQELAEADGAGGLLGLYVLATGGDEEAETALLNRLAAGRFTEVPIAWTLLQETAPFQTRSDAFLEGEVAGPYISSGNVPFARRWEAFQDLYPYFGGTGVETRNIAPDTWTGFFEECIPARDLLSWSDRHRAALHLAWLDDQHGRPAALWRERADSIEEVPGEDRPGYVRDQLWAGRGAYWEAFWDRWPDGHGHWALRMLADRGGVEAAARLRAALRDGRVLPPLAPEALKAIRARIES